MRLIQLGLIITLICLPFGLCAQAWASDIVWDFEADTGDWQLSPIDPGSLAVARSPQQAREGSGSLRISGKLPGGFGAAYDPWRDWAVFTRLSFDIYIPAGVPQAFDLQVYLKDRHYYWYQASPYRDPQSGKPTGLRRPGQWTRVSLDLGDQSRDWQPAGHCKAWYDATCRPREFGFRFFGSKAWEGAVYLDNITLRGHEPPLGPRTTIRPSAINYGLNPEPDCTALPQYEKFELTWPVARRYSNPYDPKVVAVTGHFQDADGQTITVPGFYYQAYERHKSAEGYERLTPVGGPQWKVRFAPREQGEYRYFVSIADAQDERRSREAQFTVTTPQHAEGYLRVSTQDSRYFEFESGDFFYPLSINMRDGGDQAEAQAGTYAFEHFFKLFADSGIRLVRTWMCPWWAGLEWSEKYHSRFDDLGRYSMYNAWRLDYAVDLAAQHDLYLQISLNRHGQLRRDKYDAEWAYNPYSVNNGGFLPSPAMYFTSQRARDLFRQQLRYAVARWGYSRNLMTWELFNEVDLVEAYRPAEVAAWHAEMADYLRSIDPWAHIITTHVALYWLSGDELWQLPQMEYVQSDSYWGKQDRRDRCMNESYRKRMHYEKPFIFIEYGPKTADLPVPASRWRQEFRCGLWVSTLMPHGAPAAFWYPLQWEEHKLQRYQSAVQAFNEGEDRRGKGLKLSQPTVLPPGRLNVQAMQNEDSAYFYVYNFASLGVEDPTQITDPVSGGTVMLTGLRDGEYQVEFWDTLSGRVYDQTEIVVGNGIATVDLPTVAPDLAVKVKRR